MPNQADFRDAFRQEAAELLTRAEEAILVLEMTGDDAEARNDLFRAIHTLKGSAGTVACDEVATFAHEFESLLGPLREGQLQASSSFIDLVLAAVDHVRRLLAAALDSAPASPEDDSRLRALMQSFTEHAQPLHEHPEECRTSNSPPLGLTPASKPRSEPQSADKFLRVRVDKVDEIVDLVGEVTIAYGSTVHSGWTHGDTEASTHRLDVLLRQLQDATLALRMVPIEGVFVRMKRLVRELSRQTGKQVELRILGEDTEIDRSVAEGLHDPLVHLIRNAVDHGLEMAEERVGLGKPAIGRVTLEASQSGGEIQIVVRDDGRGLDRVKILDRARALGLCASVEEREDQQVWGYIFAPGFSTSDGVTNLSGRGMGMDVVQASVEAMRGRVSIASTSGQGTAFTLHIPLTLAVLDTLLVRVAGSLFAVPVEKITEIVQPAPTQVCVCAADGQERLNLRGDLVPVLRLREYYDLPGQDHPLVGQSLMAVKSGGRSVAFPLDEIIGQQQVVVKPLTGCLKRVRAASGCALLGSGDVAIVLDPLQLLHWQTAVRAS